MVLIHPVDEYGTEIPYMVPNMYEHELMSKEDAEYMVQRAIEVIGYPLDFLHPFFGEENCSDGTEHYEVLCFNDEFRMDNEYVDRETAYYLHDKYGVEINPNIRDEDNLVSMRDHGDLTQIEFMELMRERGYIGEYD